jgi:RNA polymerase sigma-54 factor
MIQTLEPWPGRPFTDAPEQYIIPDIQVVKVGLEWQILQNEDGLPRLRVSNYYRKVLTDLSSSKADKNYIKERLESADFLIKSIFKRQRTIHKVMECILVRQKDFFDHGAERLKPMVLREVADEIEVHESTVSRVTTNKYVQCPHGIFELKYFFNAGIQRVHGEDLAAEAVKMKIRKLLNDEDSKKPLSDQKIVDLLLVQNVKIARRTVAKYREAMGFLSSSQRKNIL